MSSTSNSMRDTVRDTVKDAKDAARESAKAASAASGDIQADLEALRGDVARLTAQIGDIFAAKGSAAWGRAKSNIKANIEDVVSEPAQGAGSGRRRARGLRQRDGGRRRIAQAAALYDPCAGIRNRISVRRDAQALSTGCFGRVGRR